ncbi:MAG: IS200/IS605 family transposase [Bacteroidaceae bacterium]|nr:IS200/IS605 family transposase [Bacteroidaceae bacterium]
MAQSLAKNYIHIVFSTKNREDTMRKEDLAEIFSYISGIIKNCECNSISVGGTTNHIHILCTLNKNLALTKLIATIKANSSKWLHQKDNYYRAFAWQDGYGAFSVSQSQIEKSREYIAIQEEHHKKNNAREELISFLKAYNIEYDERYI